MEVTISNVNTKKIKNGIRSKRKQENGVLIKHVQIRQGKLYKKEDLIFLMMMDLLIGQ